MTRLAKPLTLSLNPAVSSSLERLAASDGLSPAAKAAEIVETYLLDNGHISGDDATDLRLLRRLRDEAVDKLEHIVATEGFSEDITRRTFQACQDDITWMSDYRAYIGDDPFRTGNPRKTNANQTIGSRIKSKLGASDLTDQAGRSLRARAPTGMIIQTYQLLRQS